MTSDRHKRLVEKRDNGRCLHCGATENLTVHHRKNRKMGSSRLLDRLDNYLLVCQPYNFAMESDAVVARDARDFGHKLSSWQDFSDPVFDQSDLSWWILTEDGNKIPTDAPTYLI